MEKITVDWKEQMAFTASVDGFNIELDADTQVGGQNEGPRPKPLILVALAGCTGMDVASLAKKMRLEIRSLSIDVEAEKTTEIPIEYTAFKVIYHFCASENDKDKIIKIVEMSLQRYCGVASMLRKVGAVDHVIFLNDKQI